MITKKPKTTLTIRVDEKVKAWLRKEADKCRSTISRIASALLEKATK
jgi:predicted transcriptional regulator